MSFMSVFDNSAGIGRSLCFALALAVAGSAGASASPANASTDAVRNETVVREAFDTWAAGGNVFASLLAPDIVWTIHGSGPIAGTYRGREDFVERAAMPLTSRLATPLVPKLHDVWAAGDKVVARFEATATTTGGHRYDNQYVWIFQMQDGSVAQAEAFLDLVAYQAVVDNNEPKRER